MTRLMALAPVALFAGLALAFDLPKSFGAHPWWSQTVLWIGVPAGALIAYLTGSLGRNPVFTALFALLAIASYALATYGKTQFAASYAEDVLAGKLWYFGWIAFAASSAAFVSHISLTIMARLYPTG